MISRSRNSGGLIPQLVVALGLMLCVAGGCAGPGVAGSTRQFPKGTGFIKCEFVFEGESRPLWVFVPKDYHSGRRYPTILFLHGLFEAGHTGDACLTGGLGPVIARKPEKWPFITVFPQSDGTWRGEDRDRLAMAALEFAQREYAVDPDRIILAGLSYGALGTWQIGARHPERFAALVPVSGHRATEVVERIVMLPVWAFAFASDPWVSSTGSEEMCREIGRNGGEARLTEFAGVGHDGWGLAVDQSDLVAWMLSRRRAPTGHEPRPVEAVASTID